MTAPVRREQAIRPGKLPAGSVLAFQRQRDAFVGASMRPLDFARDLAWSRQLPCIDLLAYPPDAVLCDPGHIDLYLKHLFLPWRRVDGVLVVACAEPSERTDNLIAHLYGPQTPITITSKFDVIWTIERLFRHALAHEATMRLDENAPEYSARRAISRGQASLACAVAATFLSGLLVAPQKTWAIFLVALGLCYAANILLRMLLFCAAASPRRSGYRVAPEDLAALDGKDLPVYSILVPLYREANMLRQLSQSLAGLDYPAAKLDVKLIFEEDDSETFEAAKALRLDGRFEILRVPRGRLRTKPRACNYGLRFARGEYVVIYDAEDRPEADQLKKAVAAFRKAPKETACLQARLNFYNVRDNWLTRQFALEYAGWFDFLLPGLDRLGIPIPLGGTSNHFRIEVLRALHGWDAFNVTEDADLGVRLARSGYRVLPLDSTTFEEAIPSAGGWIRQRSRWLKGYMRTALVHTRTPGRFIRAVGFGPFLGFAAFVCGSVAAALFSPLLWAVSVASIWLPVFGDHSPAAHAAFLGLLYGNVALTITAMMAPLKRRWLHLVPYGATVFAYWLLISLAAYKGLAQLLTRPFYWEKTNHGLRKGRAGMGKSLRPAPGWLRPLAAGVAVLCLFAFGVAANPWLKEQGAGEAIANLMVAQNPAGFAPAGRSANAASDMHFEYGALDNVTLVFDSDATYDKSTAAAAQGRTRFDTAWLGPRVALARWVDSVLSFETEAGLAGLYDTAWPSRQLSLNGAAQARLLFGQGFTFAGRHSFASLEGGWRWRGGAAADELTLDTTLGIAPWQNGLLMLQSFSALSTGEARAPYRRYDTHKLQLSLAQNVSDKLTVQAGLIETVAGTDAGTGGGMLALWWRF